MSFIKKNTDGVSYYSCELLEKAGFLNMFTTKTGGVSFGRNEMNFGTSCEDTYENILKNYEKALKIINSSPERTVKSKQTHSDTVLYVSESFGGEGIIKKQRFFEADGLIVSDPDMTVLVFYADCVPILIGDIKEKIVCAVHSGWRGTYADIVSKAILKMKSEPENIVAAIGPAIGVCHFEVSEQIYKDFKDKYGEAFLENKNNKFYVDLARIVELQLISAGVKKENISSSGICTYCDKEMYSYRREGDKAGRMAAFIKTP